MKMWFIKARPVTAAAEGARRGLNATELSRTGRICAFSDERVQVCDVDGLLCLMLSGNERTLLITYKYHPLVVLLMNIHIWSNKNSLYM